jgi:hypothetical protein
MVRISSQDGHCLPIFFRALSSILRRSASACSPSCKPIRRHIGEILSTPLLTLLSHYYLLPLPATPTPGAYLSSTISSLYKQSRLFQSVESSNPRHRESESGGGKSARSNKPSTNGNRRAIISRHNDSDDPDTGAKTKEGKWTTIIIHQRNRRMLPII